MPIQTQKNLTLLTGILHASTIVWPLIASLKISFGHLPIQTQMLGWDSKCKPWLQNAKTLVENGSGVSVDTLIFNMESKKKTSQISLTKLLKSLINKDKVLTFNSSTWIPKTQTVTSYIIISLTWLLPLEKVWIPEAIRIRPSDTLQDTMLHGTPTISQVDSPIMKMMERPRWSTVISKSTTMKLLQIKSAMLTLSYTMQSQLILTVQIQVPFKLIPTKKPSKYGDTYSQRINLSWDSNQELNSTAVFGKESILTSKFSTGWKRKDTVVFTSGLSTNQV